MRVHGVRFAKWTPMIAVAVMTIIPTLCGCSEGFGPGMLDSSYDVSGGYQVFRASSRVVEVIPKGPRGPDTPTIPSKVVEIGWDERYVIAKQQHLKCSAPNEHYGEPIAGQFSYWILDVKRPASFGPFTKGEFEAKRAELGVNQGLQLRGVEQYIPRRSEDD
jgi:hypothetical protein